VQNFVPQDTVLAKKLNSRATLYHRQGKYKQAEPLLKRSLAQLPHPSPERQAQVGIDIY